MKCRICTVYYVLSPYLPLKAIVRRALKATKIFPCSPKVLSGRRRGRGGGSLRHNMDFPTAASSFRCQMLTWQLAKPRKMRQPISFAKVFGIICCLLFPPRVWPGNQRCTIENIQKEHLEWSEEGTFKIWERRKKTLKKSTLEKHIQTYIKNTQGQQQASEELE